MYFFSSHAARSYAEVEYPECVFLVFGRESVGLQKEIVEENKERALRIPMLPTLRCLNLSNSVAIAVYEALRQRGFPSMIWRKNIFFCVYLVFALDNFALKMYNIF